MDFSLLEIVQLDDGEYCLQTEDGEMLVTISFSESVQNMLGKVQPVVVKSMVHAGIQAAERSSVQPQPDAIEDEPAQKTIH